MATLARRRRFVHDSCVRRIRSSYAPGRRRGQPTATAQHARARPAHEPCLAARHGAATAGDAHRHRHIHLLTQMDRAVATRECLVVKHFDRRWHVRHSDDARVAGRPATMITITIAASRLAAGRRRRALAVSARSRFWCARAESAASTVRRGVRGLLSSPINWRRRCRLAVELHNPSRFFFYFLNFLIFYFKNKHFENIFSKSEHFSYTSKTTWSRWFGWRGNIIWSCQPRWRDIIICRSRIKLSRPLCMAYQYYFITSCWLVWPKG